MKWIFIVLSLFASTLRGDIEAICRSPKAEKLNRKVIRFYVTHPKTAAYFYRGGEEVASVLEQYCIEIEKLISKYPNERASEDATQRVANIQYFLSNRERLVKAGTFLFGGIYNLETYKDPKTWRDLVSTQEAILTHYINRARLKRDDEALEEAQRQNICPYTKLEEDLMAKIKGFCQKSKDPFFNTAVYNLIEECAVREDILKGFALLRDEAKIDEEVGEITSEAEEAFQELSEESWMELEEAVNRYLRKDETFEQFIEMTSDAFDLPHLPKEFR